MGNIYVYGVPSCCTGVRYHSTFEADKQEAFEKLWKRYVKEEEPMNSQRIGAVFFDSNVEAQVDFVTQFGFEKVDSKTAVAVRDQISSPKKKKDKGDPKDIQPGFTYTCTQTGTKNTLLKKGEDYVITDISKKGKYVRVEGLTSWYKKEYFQ